METDWNVSRSCKVTILTIMLMFPSSVSINPKQDITQSCLILSQDKRVNNKHLMQGIEQIKEQGTVLARVFKLH